MRTFARQPQPAQQARPARSTRPGHAQGSDAARRFPPRTIQAKLEVNGPGDADEQEADRVADRVMGLPEPTVQRRCACGGGCPRCKAQESGTIPERVQTNRVQAGGAARFAAPPIVHDVLAASGRPLDPAPRHFMETRFGQDFGQVRVHTDEKASRSAEAVRALAYTSGRDVVFGAGAYAPNTFSGLRLLAHELAHVVQQGGGGKERGNAAPAGQRVQRTLGDGHDLTSPRFARLLDLEAAYDDETVIRVGSMGRGVQAIQQALYDLGFLLPDFGADGDFGTETKNAVTAFQRANPPLADDGEVGPRTMAALDARFAAPVLPPAAARAAPWSEACVRSLLCPWSPHTVDVLRSRITLKSFDSISWADEQWDGSSWVVVPFPGAGYNTGTEIGVLNSTCERMAETLYHEVLHAEQPSTHRTTRENESYAYRIGEEFSIAMGLAGDPGLRSMDAQGREFADRAKVDTFLGPGGGASYPGVPAGGGAEEIIGRAATHGHVRVRRPDGSIYTRPAVVGEKVDGPMVVTNPATHATATWTCP